MHEEVYTHPLYEEVLERNLRRIEACTHTISVVREEMLDPVNVDKRADLLIAAEELINEAMTLAYEARAIAWPDQSPKPIENETNN